MKNKIYVQTKHFITEDGNVTSDVSPADVFESDSVIFQEALAVVLHACLKGLTFSHSPV